MMICDADFDELFPRQAPTVRHHAAVNPQAAPDEADPAREGDDGGNAPRAALQRKPVKTHPAHPGLRLPNPAQAGIMAAMMPAMAAYGAMVAAYGNAYERRNNA